MQGAAAVQTQGAPAVQVAAPWVPAIMVPEVVYGMQGAAPVQVQGAAVVHAVAPWKKPSVLVPEVTGVPPVVSGKTGLA